MRSDNHSLKSASCFGRDGKPLSVYYSESEANEGAYHVKSHYRLNLSPYQCSRCGFWHLSPSSRQTPSRDCIACGKRLYESKEGAQKRAGIIENEQGIRLKIYRCPHQNGWHLSKRERG
ncbi:MAG: hypothetical protein LBB56_04085 [Chitinispirillales bacterium]|nr:hypothetical protein [Chitinispirillales bacterium]